jgi:hypothetical protein
MSDIIEKTTIEEIEEIEEVVKDVLEVMVEVVEEVNVDKVEVKEEVKEEGVKERGVRGLGVQVPVKEEGVEITNDLIIEITKITFSQIVESFLNENKLHTLSIPVSPEIQKYLLLLCKEKSCFFSDVEISLNKIILDNKIDTKDIPEIILLVAKVYEIITTDTKVDSKVDPYELIKTILNMVFTLYIETNKVQNKQLATELLKIIDVSIDLIKLKSINLPKIGCLHSMFKCFIE